jgi:hypothetical protein
VRFILYVLISFPIKDPVEETLPTLHTLPKDESVDETRKRKRKDESVDSDLSDGCEEMKRRKKDPTPKKRKRRYPNIFLSSLVLSLHCLVLSCLVWSYLGIVLFCIVLYFQ